MRECRCPCCGRFLVRFIPIEGLHIEIRCRRCKRDLVILCDKVEILPPSPLTPALH